MRVKARQIGVVRQSPPIFRVIASLPLRVGMCHSLSFTLIKSECSKQASLALNVAARDNGI